MNQATRIREPLRAMGTHYYDVLADIHRWKAPEWYLEIGTQTGRSLALSSARSVSVDPDFAIKVDVAANKPELHLVQDTSDAFFADGHLERLGVSFDLAFLDGMHLYEYLLRDFINTEKVMAPGGVVVMHDCLPWEPSMAERDRRNAASRAWTGDVWKVVSILREYRPDLDVTLYDAAPTGLVVVRGLDPESRVLGDAMDEIRAAYDTRTDVMESVATFEVTATADAPWARRPAKVADDALSFSIKSPARNEAVKERWGEHHFARGLADALERLGHRAEVRTRRDWSAPSAEGDIDLVLRGRAPHAKQRGVPQLLWFISGSLRGVEAEVRAADHIFAASGPIVEGLKNKVSDEVVTLLPQAFDAERMGPPEEDAPRSGIVFVGIARHGVRAMVRYALETDTPVRIWGDGWEDTEAAHLVEGRRLDNVTLGKCYGSAEIVLNDHTRAMRTRGFASNRMFDALACGAAVVSDNVAWMPEDMRPFVHCVDSPEAFAAAIAAIRAEGAERKAERRAFAASMVERHSFDARAREIVAVVRRRGIGATV